MERVDIGAYDTHLTNFPIEFLKKLPLPKNHFPGKLDSDSDFSDLKADLDESLSCSTKTLQKPNIYGDLAQHIAKLTVIQYTIQESLTYREALYLSEAYMKKIPWMKRCKYSTKIISRTLKTLQKSQGSCMKNESTSWNTPKIARSVGTKHALLLKVLRSEKGSILRRLFLQ